MNLGILSNEIFDSFETSFQSKIETVESHLEKLKEKLKDPEKKLSTLDKMLINKDIKASLEELGLLREFKSIAFHLYHNGTGKYELPKKMEEEIRRLGTLLSIEEVEKLNEVVNESLKSFNAEKKDKVKEEIAKMQKILKQLKISDNLFIIRREHKGNSDTTYSAAVNLAEKLKLADLTPEYVFISSKQVETKLSFSDETMLSKLEEMIKNNELKNTKNLQSIIENFSAIKEAFKMEAKLDNISTTLNLALAEIIEIKDVDFSKLQLFLRKLESKYLKETAKIRAFLSKFDFEEIKAQIIEKQEKEEIERIKNSKLTNYMMLSYELEKVMSEHPEDYEKIQEIKEKMIDAAMHSGFATDQLDTAKYEGKTKYHKEREEAKTKDAAITGRIAYEQQLKASIMSEIREYAIRELESSGAFQDTYEYRDGDVRSMPMNKEAMIERKIEELKSLIDMTPEERGLQDLIKHGTVSSTTTLDQLTLQQLNDLRVGYSDSAYGFIVSYKEWRAREEMKPKVNNIYRDYIRYRESLEDKTQFLSFSEFAKQYHNVENLGTELVDEELKEVIRGMSK